jgi:hypothetical protein
LLVVAGLAGGSSVSGASPPNAVTIALSRPTVVYGATVTLSGAVANRQAGEKVTVLAEAFGESSFAPLATVDTVGGGKWSYVAKPTIQTGYEAKWKSATSKAVTVKVRPKITLALVGRTSRIGTFSTTVTGARAFTGKFVLVQRLTSTGVLNLKKVTLNASSSATFQARLHRGLSRFRIVMPSSQAEPAYISGFSKVLTVRR